MRADGGRHLAGEAEGEMKKNLQPRSLVIPNWSAKVVTAVGVRDIPVKNVVGYVEGSGALKDETIAIRATTTTWVTARRARSIRAIQRFTMELMTMGPEQRACSTGSPAIGRPPNREGRRIVFIAFSGEERGLFGSLAYCEKPLFPLKDTVAMLNMDMIGRVRPDEKDKKDGSSSAASVRRRTSSDFIDDANTKSISTCRRTRPASGRAVHTSFYLAKVPVYFFFSGEHAEYHTPKDRPETINLAGIAKVVDLVDGLATTIATEKERPEYLAGGPAHPVPERVGRNSA